MTILQAFLYISLCVFTGAALGYTAGRLLFEILSRFHEEPKE